MRNALLIKILAIAFIFFIAYSSLLLAGNENYPAGARSAGLSNASVTLSEVWGTFNNQAGLACLASPVGAVYYENRFQVKELSVRAAAFALPLKPGCIALSYRSFGYSAFSESKLGLAYSLRLFSHFSAGVQLDYLRSDIGNGYENFQAVAAEAGILTEPLTNVWVGFHVFNFAQARGGYQEEDKIPAVARLGVCYRFSSRAQLMVESEKDIDQKLQIKGGLEIGMIDNLFFRVGFHSECEQYSLGLGYKFKGIMADLAFSRHQILGFTSQVSLGYEF